MSHNFDEIIPRRNSNSYKWDSAAGEDVLPMWVADMDFRTAAPIVNALSKRAEHGVFGYTKVPSAYFDAITGWFARRHGFRVDKEWILFTTGVVPAISAVIKALAAPGDQVILQSPVYNCFFSSIRNDRCEMVSSDLVYNNGTYTIDFEDLERKVSDPKAKLFLLCNPHNPVGRVWTRDELSRIGEICLRNRVMVVSDEIHCDLVHAGHLHIPFASISNEFLLNSVTCTSPSKTFNLAGLQVANIIVAEEGVRKKVDRVLNINEVCEINPFAIEALIASYDKGEPWLEELKRYLKVNYSFLRTFFSDHLPLFKVLPLEGTYLVWIDCSALKMRSAEIAMALLEKEGLWVNEGGIYGVAGEGFIRMNIACPKQRLIEGLCRFKKVFG